MTKWYDLRYGYLGLETQSAEFEKALDWFVGAFATDEPLDESLPTSIIHCVEGDYQPPQSVIDASKDCKIEMYDPCKAYYSNDMSIMYRTGEFGLEMDHVNKCSRVYLGANIKSADLQLACIFAMDQGVRSVGGALLHCASMDIPGTDERLLLYAESGTGKTTTSVALSKAGFGLSGDDTAIVFFRDGRGWCLGLPRPGKVSRHTVELLPFLEPFMDAKLWDKNEEQQLTRETLGTVASVSDFDMKRIHTFIDLRRVDGEGVSIVPYLPAEALAKVVADRVLIGDDGLTDHDASRFDLFVNMLSTVRVRQLSVDGSPEEIVAKVREEFELEPV